MARFGGVSSSTEVSERDTQAVTSAPSSPQSIIVTAAETIKRYTNIGTNITINLTGGALGDVLVIFAQNDATSARTITWGSNILAPASTATLTVSKESVFILRHNGTVWLLSNLPSAV